MSNFALADRIKRALQQKRVRPPIKGLDAASNPEETWRAIYDGVLAQFGVTWEQGLRMRGRALQIMAVTPISANLIIALCADELGIELTVCARKP